MVSKLAPIENVRN